MLQLLSPPTAAEGYLDHWTAIAQEHGADPDFAFAKRIVAARKVTVSRKRHLRRPGIESVSAGLGELVGRQSLCGPDVNRRSHRLARQLAWG